MVRHMAAEAMQAAAEGDDEKLAAVLDEFADDDLTNFHSVIKRLENDVATLRAERHVSYIGRQLMSAMSIRITAVLGEDATCAKCEGSSIGAATNLPDLRELARTHMRTGHGFEVPTFTHEQEAHDGGPARVEITYVDAAQVLPKGDCYGAGGPTPCEWEWSGGTHLHCITPH